VHYWANWNRIDREMDQRLAGLFEEYAGRICFRSCDVDRAENRPFFHGIANVPALGCFIDGKWFKFLIGLRSSHEIRSTLEGWLAMAAMPADQRTRRPKFALFRRVWGS
jgi:thioredoxin-like negative regulator of GroEL